MKRNLGKRDKSVRLILIAIIAILGLFNEFSIGVASVLGMVSILLLVSILINFSPLYYVLGISTYKENK